MKFAVSYSTPVFGVDPDHLAAFAQHAEACGFEGIYVPERVALTTGDTFGGAQLPMTLPYGAPLDLLTYVAAATDRILLGTGVLLLPYYHPVMLAKRLATIDVLSKGRMRLLTVGVGALPSEAVAAGVDFSTRGRRADEAIDVLRLLWSDDADGASYSGQFFEFKNVYSFPKPLSPLPIHVGGSSRAAARRAGLRGDGYFAGGALMGDERAAQWDLAQTTAGDRALDYTRWGSIELTPASLEAYAAQGVTRLVVGTSSPDPSEQRDQLSAFADRFNLSPSSPS
ncbi:TIGR03619 family F420-dependent LLM class oxidoreductase [Kribbella pittospori]|uniref:TIGR03619 family F420-dependent LLM class oxidoreductase n=1 Tax=Kribbella pittospori TaxID=722689 RepID=A0A4R0KGA1_9ACTN|nr:TIGR03619 family F420-dependent LLM class oxidoreductase [Kribbella pittospori]TCC58124.1 TIGR03619 family F420-dependent LLM class oxidoreductase [Kribbella pittospori]